MARHPIDHDLAEIEQKYGEGPLFVRRYELAGPRTFALHQRSHSMGWSATESDLRWLHANLTEVLERIDRQEQSDAGQ